MVGMAVAGLHNVSALDSSFLREPQSPVSRQWGSQDSPSTQASSLLQMWRELEGEPVVHHSHVRFEERPMRQRSDGSNVDLVSTDWSERQESDNGEGGLEDANDVDNESRICSQGQRGSQNENEDNCSYTSEQSVDFGEVERDRVRQIFREWRNSGIRGHPQNASRLNNCSRVQWLGENECARVRIVRDWVERTSQQRGVCGGCREQAAEIGVQIDQVPDGSLANHFEHGARRAIRKLHGRQALLDLLARAERERKGELQGLQESRPVSSFAHRNRIQSLLKGRFLRNGRLVQDEKTKSVAATELGLLRERQTVSGLSLKVSGIK
ncbi:unnamed protein product [Ilex paraguariensis]|uniref:Uncharacterized protein n=1 Tax=Ilex paraguariensis TaxID=185542 RepID=A0ABC8U068_9AQUA